MKKTCKIIGDRENFPLVNLGCSVQQSRLITSELNFNKEFVEDTVIENSSEELKNCG
jgi:hypothetical protein